MSSDSSNQVKLAAQIQDQLDADIYFYSGDIDPNLGKLRIKIKQKANISIRQKALLFLTTFGGSPDWAYRISSYLRRRYQRGYTLVCVGPCKSAGTLIAVGANEVAISDFGEFGPIDIQKVKKDELSVLNSGLDIFNALNVISAQTQKMFETTLLQITARSNGRISTKLASEIATNMSTKLFSPMMEQINPLQVGEMQRSIEITEKYAALMRDNLCEGALEKLVYGYPSHGFVIDCEEAKNIFKNIRSLSKKEEAIANNLNFLESPSSDPISLTLEDLPAAMLSLWSSPDDKSNLTEDTGRTNESGPENSGHIVQAFDKEGKKRAS